MRSLLLKPDVTADVINSITRYSFLLSNFLRPLPLACSSIDPYQPNISLEVRE